MKIIFMGTPDFAVPALQKIIDSGYNVIAVYSQPPRPKGRGMQVQKSPVHTLADTHNIPVFTPESLKKSPDEQQKFIDLKPDIAVVAAYGLILPKIILDAPVYGCVNIHASLLPRWRGASPIQHAVWKGDKKSGVTLMQMEIGLDTGPMISKGEINIHDDMTAQELHDSLSNIGGELITKFLKELVETGKIISQPQDDALANYAPLLQKTDGLIHPDASPIETYQQIRALNPWPGTYLEGLKGRVKILSGHMDGDKLVYDIVQPEGKSKMDYVSAKNGGYL